MIYDYYYYYLRSYDLKSTLRQNINQISGQKMGILNANVTKKKKKKNPDIFICWKILDTPKDKK